MSLRPVALYWPRVNVSGPRCPEGSRKLRFPDYVTMAQDGGKVVSLTHRPLLPSGNTPSTHFRWRLSRPQGHSAIRRIMSVKNSSESSWDRTSDLPIRSTALTVLPWSPLSALLTLKTSQHSVFPVLTCLW